MITKLLFKIRVLFGRRIVFYMRGSFYERTEAAQAIQKAFESWPITYIDQSEWDKIEKI